MTLDGQELYSYVTDYFYLRSIVSCLIDILLCFFASYLLSIAARLAILYYISYHLFHSQWLARGQDALVYRIDRSGQVRWSLSQVAGVRVPKAEEAVSPAEESIDLVGLEQTEVKSLVLLLS
jgi:hypothetical protein